MKQLCPATVVIAARRSIQKLEVTKLELTHSHKLSEDMYQSYRESRQKQSPPIKLPVVKCRGRPRKRVLQRQGHRNKWNEGHSMPFKHLSEESQQKMLLASITSHEVCGQVLSGSHLVKESDLEVRPERLRSSLLDYWVSLPRLKRFFTPEAWLLLQSSIAEKKRLDHWFCGVCQGEEDGTNMISCDQCLEWFHWPCVKVSKKDIQKHWFCSFCTAC
ncbi:uncharacterized protein LOC144167924 [Haemaphysalis longicornis]